MVLTLALENTLLRLAPFFFIFLRMIFSCLACISVIYQQLVRPFISRPQSPREPLPNDIIAEILSRLPNDIIAEILSRLPAECVLHCRRVCKEWNSLISTSYFIELHLKRATPTIVVHYWSNDHKNKICFINELGGITDKRRPRSKNIITSDRILDCLTGATRLRFSCDGLLVLEPLPNKFSPSGSIDNPITHDNVLMVDFFGEICGLFFHPIAKDYRVLWLASGEKKVEFKIFNLGLESHGRRLSNFTSQPRNDLPPVNLYGALHWMSYKCCGDDGTSHDPTCTKSITIFSIVNEEFQVMPHPGDVSNCSHTRMHLLDLDGNLCLSHFLQYLGILEIWVLEDHANWLWTKKHNINLQLDLLSKQVPDVRGYTWVRPLGFQNGALVLNFRNQGVFSYHPQQKTIKKFIFDKGTEKSVVVGLHTKSLVSIGKLWITNFSRN